MHAHKNGNATISPATPFTHAGPAPGSILLRALGWAVFLVWPAGIALAQVPDDANLSQPSVQARESESGDQVDLPNGPLRLVIVFTPNGMVREGFWPEQDSGGDATDDSIEITPVLEPLAEFRDEMLLLKGICNRVRGDGDNHMRGIAALLTGIEMFPGNIQGGSHTPAGWSKGISIDQELRNFLQSQTSTRTRFGSLEFGICVRNDANPWTRMVYAGPNQPLAPISDPYAMFEMMYGAQSERENLLGVLDSLEDELASTLGPLAEPDRARLLALKSQVDASKNEWGRHAERLPVPPPELPPGIAVDRRNMPELTQMQLDLLVNGLANNLNRIATVQFTESVGNAKMQWLDIDQGHHELSHDPDLNESSQEKLTRINQWYAKQMAYLLRQLRDTDDPSRPGSLLDNTLVIWTNELGHGNSHTLDNIPMLLLGGKNFGYRRGCYVRHRAVPHNRLWLTIAQSMGHDLQQFGNPKFCRQGALDLAWLGPESSAAEHPNSESGDLLEKNSSAKE